MERFTHRAWTFKMWLGQSDNSASKIMIHHDEWMAAHSRNQKLASRLPLRSSMIARGDEPCKDCASHTEWRPMHARDVVKSEILPLIVVYIICIRCIYVLRDITRLLPCCDVELWHRDTRLGHVLAKSLSRDERMVFTSSGPQPYRYSEIWPGIVRLYHYYHIFFSNISFLCHVNSAWAVPQ